MKQCLESGSIPMGTNCAPLVTDLFLYCYERDFMDSLNHDNQADVIEAFNSTTRYLDDLLNIDNPYFEGMVNQIYPPELQLNKANISDNEAPFLDLHLSVANGFVSSKIYKMVQVGKDQEKAQSEKDSHSKNRGGKKTKPTIRYPYHETIVSRMGSYFPNRWPLSYLNLTKNMRQQHKKKF